MQLSTETRKKYIIVRVYITYKKYCSTKTTSGVRLCLFFLFEYTIVCGAEITKKKISSFDSSKAARAMLPMF